jgi:hypothetical protein
VTPQKRESSSATARDYRITPSSPWAGAWKGTAAVGALGLGVAAFGYKSDPARFAYAYLFGYYVALSLALGSLFFVLVLYMTKASWGVTSRRIAELFMREMRVLVLLVIPLVFMVPQLFPWAGAKHADTETSAEGTAESATNREKASPLAEARGIAAREPVAMRDLPLADAKRMAAAEETSETRIVLHKGFFLNKLFFLVRLILYMVAWCWLSYRYFQWSSEQDKENKTKALANTAAAQRLAPLGIILFATTLTFFAFDWLLSLDATWYSTIFGVYVFAQCALFQMAVLILVTLMLRKSGLLGNAVNVEHYHDMGKLLFGWIVFWSYIAFAQFFLTWYANIPDEVAVSQAMARQRGDVEGGQCGHRGAPLLRTLLVLAVAQHQAQAAAFGRWSGVHGGDAHRRSLLDYPPKLRAAGAHFGRPRLPGGCRRHLSRRRVARHGRVCARAGGRPSPNARAGFRERVAWRNANEEAWPRNPHRPERASSSRALPSRLERSSPFMARWLLTSTTMRRPRSNASSGT